MTDIVQTVLVSITTSLITAAALLFYRPFLQWAELKYEKLIWRAMIPQGFKGKDILLEITKKGKLWFFRSFEGTKLIIFDETYSIIGLLEYDFGGNKYFLLQIKPEKEIKTRYGVRFVGFEADAIMFWAETSDEDFWDRIIGKKFHIPDTISMEYIKEELRKQLEPVVMFGNQKAKLYEAKYDGKIMILSGKYAMWQASCSRIKFAINDSVHICCVYYGNELCDSDVYIGKEISESDIQLVRD